MLCGRCIAAVFCIFLVLLLFSIVVAFVVGYCNECIVLLLDARDELGELNILERFKDVFRLDGLVIVEDSSVIGTKGGATSALMSMKAGVSLTC